MRITKTRAALGGVATLSVAILLAGCAPAPATSGGSTSSASASNFLPCMVSDAGGFDDKSFNQAGFEGLQTAAKAAGVTPITVQSNAETDFAPNLTQLVDQNCSLIISVGFALSKATVESALANPKIQYSILDDAADNDFNGKTDAPNIKPLLFNTAQAAFLGGYAAAAYSKAGKVATWGGMNYPTVTIFMDGFAQGVAYYNKVKNANVQVLGYDPANPGAATFTGGFEANDIARTTAKNFIDQGADVLLPVGGPIYQSAGIAIQDSKKDVVMLGVDKDLYVSDPTYKSLYLTSILKGIGAATQSVVGDAAAGKFTVTPYVGTLANQGVGLAPFHDFSSKVPSSLQGEIDQLSKDIQSGKIAVKSYLNG